MRSLERLVPARRCRTDLNGSPARTRGLPATASLRAIVAAMVCGLVVGCSEPGLDAAYRNYLERLGNTLDVEPEGIATQPGPRYPRTGKLQQAIEGDDLDTLEFLSLSGCAVQVTIGKRNSSLGRVAPPSQRLLLELEYLRLAPACVTTLRQKKKDALADALENAWQAKRTQLPTLVFNATLGGAEFRALWRTDSVPGEYPPVQSSAVIAALEAIKHNTKRWLSGDYEADNTAFELLLSDVAGGDGGIVLQALARQRAWLAKADALLATRREQGPLCAPGIRHDAATILPRVAQKFFVGEIQPHAAAMERRMYALLPPLQALEAQLGPALPPLYQQWQQARDTLLADARAAPARHVAALQASLAGCDNLPQV